MQSDPPSLLELQQALAQALRHGVGSEVASVVAGDELAPQARLGIYRNTAIGTLVTALRLTYPAIQALVGPECFEGAARLYIEGSPPQSAWLDGYGAAFPDFLARLPEVAPLHYLPDTARIEWAVNAVLHAPDTAPLELSRLAGREDVERGEVRFISHPAARLLRSDFPVDVIWRAVLIRDDRALEAIDLNAGPVWLLVLRTPRGIDVERLSEEQYRFAAALFAGQPLHAALESAPLPEVHTWLATLLASGCFTAIGMADQAPDRPFQDLTS